MCVMTERQGVSSYRTLSIDITGAGQRTGPVPVVNLGEPPFRFARIPASAVG